MNRTESQVRKSARDGAALLDVQQPNWAWRVELARLALSDCRACVLGQLYGDQDGLSGYERGVLRLSGLPDEPRDPRTDATQWALEHGFLGLGAQEYAWLDNEWRQLIAERAA